MTRVVYTRRIFTHDLLYSNDFLTITIAKSPSTTANDRDVRILKKKKGSTRTKGGSKGVTKAPSKKNKKQKNSKAAKSPKGGNAVTFQPSSQPSSPQPSSPCTVIVTQKDALLALKEGFINGDTELADWDSNTDPCAPTSWTGITCSGSDVTEIDVGK
jgi:hypothetical protein